MRRDEEAPDEVSQAMRCWRFENGRGQIATNMVVRESLVRLHVNGRELTSLMCTPRQLDLLALGFLRSEGVITGLADVRLLKVCPSRTCVEVWLWRADFEPPTGRVITSGCGGGITFMDLAAASQALTSAVRVSPGQLWRLMRAMQDTQDARGIHTSALAEGEALLAVIEDIGRHNTIDKLWGYCLAHGIATQDKILISTGRISSEMLGKAARMGVPVVVSRTSPTSMSVALAQAWNVTLIGYLRRDGMSVYAGQERIIEDEEELADANTG